MRKGKIYLKVADLTGSISYPVFTPPHPRFSWQKLVRREYKPFLTKPAREDFQVSLGEGNFKMEKRAKELKVDTLGSVVFNIDKREAYIPQVVSLAYFDFFLRFFLGLILPEFGGAVFHASSIRRGKRGELFLGEPGTGKSTIVSLASAVSLSDDNAVVRKRDEKFYIYPSPFKDRNEAVEKKFPALLSGLFFLKKAKKTERRELGPERALPLLMSHLRPLFKDAQTLKGAFAICNEICQSTPCFLLKFTKDKSFLEALDG